ncbi:hypothetical protein GCM10010413_36560 [Promicromonospora sukumoe]|uniref:Uncharacterized protein n=1 Tax=Promicromonospora sukumoe TaxID=88382 RepID=A0A7W3PDB0_9MICO|nr:hypothetical protein [Promicromonospora sukumoe]MBA8807598.1 hypothetical protein [Promicromonospora sukumoe]
MSGPDQVHGADPGEPELPGPDAQDEVPVTQGGVPADASELSLLRMLGWRPGDPLPDVDGLNDAPDEIGNDGQHFPSSGRSLGGSTASSDADPLLPEEPEPVVPINWNTLDPERAEQEWWQLDAFVYWLRDDFGLTPQELPPMWHRHPELVWELSALRTSWLAGHAEDAHPGSPLVWLRDLSDSRRRLRDWVQRCGTTLTEDRSTRRTTWPGEQAATSPVPVTVADRAADFAVFVADDVARRRQIEADAQAEIEEARARRLSRLREQWGLPGTSTSTTEPAPDGQSSAATDQEGTP